MSELTPPQINTKFVVHLWWITAVIIAVNVGLFFWQVLHGMDVSNPSTADAIHWGADYAPLTFIPVVQEPEADWTGKTGLVHKAIMDDFVSLHDYDIYVAGRFEMAGAAREEFKVLGAEPERIFGDAYEFI